MNNQAIEILNKYQDLNLRLSEAVKNSNSIDTQKLSREIGEIIPSYQIAFKINKIEQDIQEANNLLKEEQDNKNIEFYNEIIESNQEQLNTLSEELSQLLIERDPNDSRDVIIEIRAGTGGEEAALFASELYRMYLRFCEHKLWNVEQLSLSEAEQGGIKEVICSIEGKNVYGILKYESGVHRVQRVPATEAAGRIHTSSASVVVLPKIEDNEASIDEDDVKIDLYRAGGPGGQGVNTTDSAVRLTHIPSGLVVSCQDERSQLKNKLRAMSILKSRLYDLQQQQAQDLISGQRRNAIKSGDRSDKIKTYNFPQNRMTDHRIKQSWYNLATLMEGHLEEMLDTTHKIMRSENVT